MELRTWGQKISSIDTGGMFGEVLLPSYTGACHRLSPRKGGDFGPERVKGVNRRSGPGY